ncbi:MAG: CARDB domain-containing protein [Pseudomonadota bacterium]
MAGWSTFSLDYTIYNNGVEDTAAFNMAVHLTDSNSNILPEWVQTDPISMSDPFTSFSSVAFNFSGLNIGTHYFYVEADHGNAVDEFYESNNISKLWRVDFEANQGWDGFYGQMGITFFEQEEGWFYGGNVSWNYGWHDGWHVGWFVGWGLGWHLDDSTWAYGWNVGWQLGWTIGWHLGWGVGWNVSYYYGWQWVEIV